MIMQENNLNPYKARRRGLLQMIFISLFAAICYVILFLIRIPYPAPSGKPFIHLGNMVVIVAALLLGGWQGGLAGAIGMGLNDVVMGYGYTSIETFILKFGIGLFVGLVAGIGRRHPDKSPRTALGVSSAVSLIFGVYILIGKVQGWSSFAGISPVAYIFLLTLGVLLAVLTILSLKFSFITNEVLFAAFGAVAGIAWNLVGEFLGGAVILRIAGSGWQAAMITSLASNVPPTIINGVFSIIGAMLLYVPLKKALHAAHLDEALAK